MEQILIEFDPARRGDPEYRADYADAIWNGLGRPAEANRAEGRLDVPWQGCRFWIEVRVPPVGLGQAVIGWAPQFWWFRDRRCRRAAEGLREQLVRILWRVRA